MSCPFPVHDLFAIIFLKGFTSRPCSILKCVESNLLFCVNWEIHVGENELSLKVE
jgi:hypothetical protein